MLDMIDADALKQRVDYRDYLVARLGEGKREGRIMKWSSPFRNGDSDPSFKHKDGHEYAKDYGTGEAFDIYAFIQRIDGVSFREAVESLNQWVGGSPVTRTVKPKPTPVNTSSYAQVTWDEIRKAEQHYLYVKPYVELQRRISGEVAHRSHLGGVTWSKVISFYGKTERIPINRVTFPYYYGEHVHGVMSRLDDLTTMERLEWEFKGITEATRHKIWQSNPQRDIRSITNKDILNAIHENMWTPENMRDNHFNRVAMLRWHQKGRRSIFNVDPFCRIENGVYRWNVNVIIIHESETDALACQSVTPNNVANIAYKQHNPINTPLWKVLGEQPIVVMIAVQNDDASKSYARQISERLAYSKENYGKSNYVLQYLYTPQGYKDFGEMQQQNVLRDFFLKTPIGVK